MKKLLFFLLLAKAITATADTIPDVNERLHTWSDPMVGMADYTTPVARQWMADVSIGSVGVAFLDERRGADIDPQLGEGERVWRPAAETYIKHGTSTLWGSASYDNGLQRNVRYNETADIDIVYPYVAADLVGGDIKLERYAFGGGYADHRGCLSWGAGIGYKAGLYYRDVDPRPKNVTGRLDISAGAGYMVWGDHDLSSTVTLQRYTQGNDIAFRSEMGVEKIYHLTGLGNHYYRFAGQGLSAHYGGYKYGVGVYLTPRSRKGLSAGIEVSRFTFEKILKDLNELPMASVWHNALSAQASWLAPGQSHDWSVMACFDAYRRHGRENIFGDASSNIYPQIGQLVMYADNHMAGTITALYCYHTPTRRVWLKPCVGFSHRLQVYVDPPIESPDNRWSATVQLGASAIFGIWRAESAIEYRYEADYGNMIFPNISLSRAISAKQAIMARFGYSQSKDYSSLSASVAIIF